MVKPCKDEEHTRIYISDEFVWCSCCGALHRIKNIDKEKDTSEDVGSWVLPSKDLTKEEFLELVEIDEKKEFDFKIIEGGLVN